MHLEGIKVCHFEAKLVLKAIENQIKGKVKMVLNAPFNNSKATIRRTFLYRVATTFEKLSCLTFHIILPDFA